MTQLSASMPTAEQNALVQKYCAVCHSDAFPNGKLSLQHFDASHPDPGVAAMLVSKLKGGALGAAGIPTPDRATREALLNALSAEAADSTSWFVNPPSESSPATVSIVRETRRGALEPDLYRLTVTCRPDTRALEMVLAWSPDVPASGQEMTAVVDGSRPVTHILDGSEKMGNGQPGKSGPGAIVLALIQLPEKTLEIANVFPNETVVFPFSELPKSARETLSKCSGYATGWAASTIESQP